MKNKKKIEIKIKIIKMKSAGKIRISMKQHEDVHEKITFIEVCAGAGGLSSGLIKAGFIPLLLNDINQDCCRTLMINHPNVKVECCSMNDLVLTDYIGQIDLLTGGGTMFRHGH